MRLVIEYAIGDGYTYSATDTVPVEYESAEAFAVEFEAMCLKHVRGYDGFMFAGRQWYADAFFGQWDHKTESRPYFAPNIFTVDEWFAHHGA